MKRRLLVGSVLIFCILACLACGGGKLRGTYVAIKSDENVYVELNAGNKCKVYALKKDSEGNMKSKDELDENLDLVYSGTYQSEGDTITLFLINKDAFGSVTVEHKGKVLSNGNIRIEELLGYDSITLKKQ